MYLSLLFASAGVVRAGKKLSNIAVRILGNAEDSCTYSVCLNLMVEEVLVSATSGESLKARLVGVEEFVPYFILFLPDLTSILGDFPVRFGV